MRLLELFGNLPYAVLNCPSPRDYYRAGYEAHKREQDEERQRIAQMKYFNELVKKPITDNGQGTE